ncbi:MAG: hypothetical protein AAB514_02055 [Patescibacteria group bacterium]
MDNSLKKIIVVLATAIVLTLMYFGAYLPSKKSQLYIKAILAFQTGKIKSLQDFDAAFGAALNFYSPVGQDELVSYYFGNLANVVNQQNNEEIIKALAEQAENLMKPIIKAGKGFGYSQNLYNFAVFYKIVALKLNSDVYLQKSIDLFKEGLKNSPNRYIFLEGLFDVYRIKGDKAGMKEIGEIILKYWPEKEAIRQALSTF